jgi:threonine/homoserine/homoserine lactone efflux protein
VPQLIEPSAAIEPQMAILGATSIVIEIAALSVYLAICDRARTTVGPAVQRGLQRAGGGLLVAAGAQLATLRRS